MGGPAVNPTSFADRAANRAAIVVWILASAFAPLAAGQAYPSKSVRLEVGAPAGGGTDIVARMLGDKLGESLKQPFVVENRPGASNTIAADFTAKSAPDGGKESIRTFCGVRVLEALAKSIAAFGKPAPLKTEPG